MKTLLAIVFGVVVAYTILDAAIGAVKGNTSKLENALKVK